MLQSAKGVTVEAAPLRLFSTPIRFPGICNPIPQGRVQKETVS
jgi:hypothetical protein